MNPPGNDDTIFGNGGNDTIDGGLGNDTIIGDGNSTGEASQEYFQWEDAPNFGDNVDAAGFTQNTGSVNVTFAIDSSTSQVDNEYETDAQQTGGLLAGVNNNASFESVLNGDSQSAQYSWATDAPVENVMFRVNDIDGDGRIVVRAFDADGNPISVTLSNAGAGLALSNSDGVPGNDTATSIDNNYTADNAAEHSVLVSIVGPVSRWEIEHQQDGGNNSGINVTDISFDAAPPAGIPSDDVIEGGEGDDVTYGDNAEGFGTKTIAEQIADKDGAGGNDTFIGGEGADQSWGEGGDDTVLIRSAAEGAGDVVVGGNGPDETADNDTLDLRGAGKVTIVAEADDSDSGAQKGTVTFEDGSTLQFFQIETILTDPQNTGPDAADDTVNVNEDETVTFDPLANDSDPDGDPLSIVSISDPANGTLTDNGDGTFTYAPNENYNGPDSVTYTIEDPSGETSTATVSFNVTPVNDAPDAVNDTAVTDEEVAVTLTPLANDTDVDGDDLTRVYHS